MKKAQPKQMKIRHWMTIFILLAVMGIILVNSFYLKGYSSSEISYESGNLILDHSGYISKEKVFQYTGKEESYVQITGIPEAEQILLLFEDEAEEDTVITVQYTNQKENRSEEVSEGKWKKGTSYAKIDIIKGKNNSYFLTIPSDFSLSKAYLAVDNGYSGISKPLGILFVLMLSAVLTTCFMTIHWTRRIVEETSEKLIQFLLIVEENRKTLIKYILIFGGMLLVGIIVTCLLAKMQLITFSGKVVMLACLLSILLSMILSFYKKFSKKLEWMGFFVILLVGTIISFLELPNVGIAFDDEIHYRNAVQLSHLFDQKISAADLTLIGDYTKVILERKNYGGLSQRNYIEFIDELEAANYYIDMQGYSVQNTLISYVPSAIGIAFARGLGLPFHVTLAVGRWMNVLLLGILSYFAMKKLRMGKMVVLLIALLPNTIFAAANYSYDTWLLAWSILGLSAFLGEWQQPEKRIDRLTPWLIGISMYLAVLPKQVYFPLTFIPMFLPRSKFEGKKECWTYRCIILAAALLPFSSVYLSNIAGNGMGKGDIRGGAEVDATAQMEYIQNYPIQAARTIGNFLKRYLNPWAKYKEDMNCMGYLGDTPISTKILLITVILGAFVSRDEKEAKFPWWTRAGALFVYFIIGFIAAVSMYIAFTPVGLDTVLGCQRRYLIPVLFPTVYILSRFSGRSWIKDKCKEENVNIILLLILVSATVSGLWVNCLSLY